MFYTLTRAPKQNIPFATTGYPADYNLLTFARSLFILEWKLICTLGTKKIQCGEKIGSLWKNRARNVISSLSFCRNVEVSEGSLCQTQNKLSDIFIYFHACNGVCKEVLKYTDLALRFFPPCVCVHRRQKATCSPWQPLIFFFLSFTFYNLILKFTNF